MRAQTGPELAERVLDLLEELGGELAEGGREVFEIAVREALVTGAVDAGWATLSLALLAVIAALAVRWTRQAPDRQTELSAARYDDWAFPRAIGAAVGGALALLVFVLHASSAVHHLANPRWHGLKILLEELR